MIPKRKSKEDSAQTPDDLVEDEYSTVTDCASSSTADGAPGEPTAPVPQDSSLNMVDCDLYSFSAGALEGATNAAMPDISPYACFYGASNPPVLKAGWLDKLSPQG